VKKSFLAIWLAVALVCTAVMIYAQDTRDDQKKQGNDYSSEAQEDEDYQSSIMEVLAADDRFSIFVDAIKTAGLSEMLDEDEILTVFAPTDSAFYKIPAEELDRIMGDRKVLKEILSGHIVEDDLWTDDLVEADSVETINHKTLIITEVDKQVLVDSIPIIDPDIDCYNGVIQVIGSVIMPASGD
jgi:transforming growth factor-beta-induced protein